MTYTYNDIVTAKDILTGKVKKEDIIGKKGWLLDCIPQDMSLNVIERIGLHACLDGIDLDSGYPFGNCDSPYTYFLPEKEAEYVPFDLSDPKDRDFLRERWVKAKETEAEGQIVGFRKISTGKWTADIGWSSNATSEALFEVFAFLDGSVIGKPANGHQMKQLAILQGVSSKILVDSGQESK